MDTLAREQLNKLLRQTMDAEKIPTACTKYEINPQLTATLTPLQQSVINNQSKRIALLWGRRAAKSWTLAVSLLLAAARHPRSTALFLSTSREHAKRLLWNHLQHLSDRFFLNLEFNGSDLMVNLPNQSRIWIHGCACRADAEKFRGDKYSIVCIDEAGAFPNYMDYLLRDVLLPACADHNAPIILAGTPSPTCTGTYHDICTTDSGYDVIHATVKNNPAFPLWSGADNWQEQAAEFLSDKATEPEWLHNPSAYQREWLAQWVRDTRSLLLTLTDDSYYSELPDHDWVHVIGIDIGVNDPNAIVVLAYSPSDPHLYVVDAVEQSDMSYSALAALILKYNDQYKPHSIVADPSPGAQIIRDLSDQYGIPIQAADKRDRAYQTNIVAQEFAEGRIKIASHLTDFIDQLKQLMWNDKHDDIRDHSISHLWSALRYGYTECRHYFGRTPEPVPTPQQRTDLFVERHQKQLEQQIQDSQYYQSLLTGDY